MCHFIEAIAQNTVDLTYLINGGQDPHTYRATPSDRQALEKAQMIFYGGYNLESQLINLIEAVDSDIPKIAVHEAVVTEPIMAQHNHEGHEGHEDHTEELSADPHVWHDVDNAIATVEYLQSSLVELNSDRAALYLKNLARLTNQLKELHVWIQE